jgi:hypothetical protein
VRAGSREAIVRAFRDMALVDRDDTSCGIVDDVQVEEVEPGVWQLKALLVGPGAWARRRPRWLTALLPGNRMVSIDPAEVASETSVIRLMKRSEELGLAPLEHRLLRAWRKVPPIDH